MKAPSPPARPLNIAVRFRAEIEKAMSEGVALDDLELHLTRGDAEKLKRDRNVAVADISFANGVMTFLGVKVTTTELAKGQVAPPSALRRRVVETA